MLIYIILTMQIRLNTKIAQYPKNFQKTLMENRSALLQQNKNNMFSLKKIDEVNTSLNFFDIFILIKNKLKTSGKTIIIFLLNKYFLINMELFSKVLILLKILNFL